MLTVKHISLAGNESHYLADVVEFEPRAYQAHPIPDEDKYRGGIVTVRHAGHIVTGLEGGTVFVMNDIGKTVSRYDLGASMVPLESGGIGGLKMMETAARHSV